MLILIPKSWKKPKLEHNGKRLKFQQVVQQLKRHKLMLIAIVHLVPSLKLMLSVIAH